MIGVLGELGEETHDRVGVQQLRHAEVRALIALEVEPALFTFAGGDQDHAAVGDLPVVDRQGIGGRDTGTFTVVHGAGHPDEHDSLEPGVTQVVSRSPRAASSMKAVTWVHSPLTPGSSGLMIDQ